MKKNEIKILSYELKMVLESESLGIDKSEEKALLLRLMHKLNLEQEIYNTINNFLIESKNYSPIEIDLFEMIENSFKKYNYLIEYKVDYIEDLYENDAKYLMSEEENKYFNIRINQLKNRLNKEGE